MQTAHLLARQQEPRFQGAQNQNALGETPQKKLPLSPRRPNKPLRQGSLWPPAQLGSTAQNVPPTGPRNQRHVAGARGPRPLHSAPTSSDLNFEATETQSMSATHHGVRRRRARQAMLLHEPAKSRLDPIAQFRKAPLQAACGASPRRGRGVLRVAHRLGTHTDLHLEFRAKTATEPASPPQCSEYCLQPCDPKHSSGLRYPWPPSARPSWSREPTDDLES